MTRSMTTDQRAPTRAEAFRAWPISDVESVFLLDRAGLVVAAGPRAEVLLRRRHDELVGQPLELLLEGGPGLSGASLGDGPVRALVRRSGADIPVTVDI